jgi:hypothetical protein
MGCDVCRIMAWAGMMERELSGEELSGDTELFCEI